MKSPFTPAGNNPRGSFNRQRLVESMRKLVRMKNIEAQAPVRVAATEELVREELSSPTHMPTAREAVLKKLGGVTSKGTKNAKLGEAFSAIAEGETNPVKVLNTLKHYLMDHDIILPSIEQKIGQQELTFHGNSPVLIELEKEYGRMSKQFGENKSTLLQAIESVKYQAAKRIVQQRAQQAGEKK